MTLSVLKRERRCEYVRVYSAESRRKVVVFHHSHSGVAFILASLRKMRLLPVGAYAAVGVPVSGVAGECSTR